MSFSCPNLFSPLTLTPRIIPLCFSSSSYQEKTDVPVDLDLDKYLSFGITCLSIIVTMHCSYEVTDQSVIYKSHIIHTHRHSLLYSQGKLVAIKSYLNCPFLLWWPSSYHSLYIPSLFISWKKFCKLFANRLNWKKINTFEKWITKASTLIQYSAVIHYS